MIEELTQDGGSPASSVSSGTGPGQSETYSPEEKAIQTPAALPIFEAKLSDVEKKLLDMVAIIRLLEKNVESAKTTNIEILALFVAFFTFVSIEFQLAKNFSFSQFLFFSPFFAGLLSFFTFILHITIQDKINLKNTIIIFILILMFCFVGFLSNVFLVKIENTTIQPSTKNTETTK